MSEIGMAVEDLAGRLRAANRVVVLSGAGMSAASGIKTYRGRGGMWNDADLFAAHHASALPGSLPIIWATKGALRAQLLRTEPNVAHRAVVDLEHHLVAKGGELVIVTQNIDGLHQRAGSTRVFELHGSVMRSSCSDRACPLPPFYDESVPVEGPPLPSCPGCGQPLRPAIVLFEEALPAKVMWRAEEASAPGRRAVGGGNLWRGPPPAGLVDMAAISGAYSALVNSEPWDHPHPDIMETLIGPAEEVLPALVVALSTKRCPIEPY